MKIKWYRIITLGFILSFLFMGCFVFVYGENTIEDRLRALEQKIVHIENMGGKHLKPNKITVGDSITAGTSINAGTYIVAGTSITAGDAVIVSATKKLYFDGGNNTYIIEQSADNLELVVGGSTALGIETTRMVAYLDLVSYTATGTKLGNASNYFGEVHCSDVVDHSKKEKAEKNAVEAIKKISIEDKSTYPVDVYIPAKSKKDKDGTSMNQLIVYLIDAIKELDKKKLDK